MKVLLTNRCNNVETSYEIEGTYEEVLALISELGYVEDRPEKISDGEPVPIIYGPDSRVEPIHRNCPNDGASCFCTGECVKGYRLGG